MTEDTRPEPKKRPATAGKNEPPVHVIREGAIAASIWRRSTGHGLTFLEFTLSRSWQSKMGNTGYSQAFFPRNEAQLINVIGQATKWISEAEAKNQADAEALAA